MLVPIFGCDDVVAATQFYKEIFNCKVLANFQLAADQPNPGYATLEFRGHHLHLNSFPANQGTGKAAYVYIDEPQEVDRLYDAISKRTDVKINIPLVDQSWGMREFGFIDPFGNALNVGAQLSETPPSTPGR